MQDLQEIYSGTLFEFLENIIVTCQEHVYKCVLCSQRGFICEICRDPKIIYPFNLTDNHRVREPYANCILMGTSYYYIEIELSGSKSIATDDLVTCIWFSLQLNNKYYSKMSNTYLSLIINHYYHYNQYYTYKIFSQ